MLFFSQWRRFRMITSRHFALLIVCALILSLCRLLTISPSPTHSASPGPLVTAINAGRGSTGNFVANTYYNTGNVYLDTSTSIHTKNLFYTSESVAWECFPDSPAMTRARRGFCSFEQWLFITGCLISKGAIVS
jgi:hypothetical protein